MSIDQGIFRNFWERSTFFSELCWGKAVVAYTMPQQRKKEESERLRGERDQIQFIDLRFEWWQAAVAESSNKWPWLTIPTSRSMSYWSIISEIELIPGPLRGKSYKHDEGQNAIAYFEIYRDMQNNIISATDIMIYEKTKTRKQPI